MPTNQTKRQFLLTNPFQNPFVHKEEFIEKIKINVFIKTCRYDGGAVYIGGAFAMAGSEGWYHINGVRHLMLSEPISGLRRVHHCVCAVLWAY